MKDFFKNRRAQLSIVNMLFFVILIICAVAVTPIISQSIHSGDMYQNGSSIERLIYDAIVPFFWLGIIITFFMYISPLAPNFRQFQ